MVLAFVIFIVLFLLIAGAGILFFVRNPMAKRVEDVVAGNQADLVLDIEKTERRSPVAGFLERIGTRVPHGGRETSTLRQNLIHAGYREASAVNLMYGLKVLLPLVALVVILFAWHPSNFLVYIIAAGVGYILPDYLLQVVIRKRQKALRKGLPDVLDLLVICVEAGLSLDQALARTASELTVAHPSLSDELNLVVLEQSAGSVRGEAWRHLAERTGVDSIRHLVTTIIQAEQFGTSIAKTLRVHSQTLRQKRKQALEEEAAKTSVKLVFPLVLFIFPSLLLVTLGPALISIAKTMPTLMHH